MLIVAAVGGNLALQQRHHPRPAASKRMPCYGGGVRQNGHVKAKVARGGASPIMHRRAPRNIM